MKKITLLLALLTVSFGYSQTFPLDFSDPLDDFQWDPSAGMGGDAIINATTEKLELFGNAADWDNAFIVFAGGDVVDLSDELNNTIAFLMDPLSTLPVDEVRTHRIRLTTTAGNYEVPFTTTGDAEQTILINPGALGDMTELRIFIDAGEGNSSNGNYAIDDIFKVADPAPTCDDGIQNQGETGVDCGGPCDACPTPATPAPTPPARDPSAVVSFYSNQYTNNTDWDQIEVFSGSFTDDPIDGNDTYLLNPNVGFQYNYFPSSSVDLSGMTHYHADIWVGGSVVGGEVFTVQAINFDGMDAVESNNFYQFPITTTEEWVTIDVPIASFANAVGNTNYNNIKLLQIILQGPAYGPVWLDNLYFHNGTTLGTDDFEIEGLSLYPNPSKNKWTVKTNNISMSSIEVFDILGKRVMSLSPNASEAKIDGSTLTAGLYFAQIKSEGGNSTLKLVKQ